MKYYLIVGEASGDLHAAELMKALKIKDPEAEFRFLGGDLMSAVGGTRVKHYKEMAYMGIIPVLLHLRTILRNMRMCKQDIVQWNPDVLILVDYPGFNLKIAQYIHSNTSIPVYYYIAPKIWAWKEYRIKNIKRDVDQLFSILPFELDFFEKKHNYPIHYVGNPTMDEVTHFLTTDHTTKAAFIESNKLSDKPIIALLAGSRKQEVKDNLTRMIEAASRFKEYQLVIAGAPSLSMDFYERFIQDSDVKIIFDQTYNLLRFADAALVTSGTATLETALFNTPQVVCYYLKFGRLFAFLKKIVLRVKYVSLVNLIANHEVVPELIANEMNSKRVSDELEGLLYNKSKIKQMIEGYDEVRERLGMAGAPQNAATLMVEMLSKTK